jgi:hypothetical protein
MARTASVVAKAMAGFGSPYPREREIRHAMMDTYTIQDLCRGTPFDSMDEEFFTLIASERGGFASAADTYAAAHGARTPRTPPACA